MKALCSNLIFALATTLLVACERQGVPSESLGEAMKDTALEHAVKHTDPRYVCPMHPQIIRDQAGSCPICGMDLVPMDAQVGSAQDTDNPMVEVSPAIVNSMGVRTAIVERGRLWRGINTVGYVGYDESRLSHVHLRTDGWIERLYVRSEGERVEQGNPLFELYSPTLINAQEEYLQALAVGNQSLIGASQERLIALGLTQKQVNALSKSRRVNQKVIIHALQDGVVAALNVREGMYVKPATEVLSLADLSSVWVLAEVFEQQSEWVKEGQAAQVRLSYLPGRQWEGRVEYIYPSLNPKTRTLKVRLRFDNVDEQLKPNMYADVTLYGGAKQDVLYVPREAVIRTSTDQRVILALGEGRFQARDVIAGLESGEYVEIITGLDEGNEVVVSGQFLIDSEASLKASLMRMSAPALGRQDMDEAHSEQGGQQ
jgi:Cu(I)/Ag(I) efflux system membrane fusion protein